MSEKVQSSSRRGLVPTVDLRWEAAARETRVNAEAIVPNQVIELEGRRRSALGNFVDDGNTAYHMRLPPLSNCYLNY